MCGPSPCHKPNCTWSESHRRECEARAALALPLAIRREFLATVEKRRGKPAADALKTEMTKQFAKRSGAR